VCEITMHPFGEPRCRISYGGGGVVSLSCGNLWMTIFIENMLTGNLTAKAIFSLAKLVVNSIPAERDRKATIQVDLKCSFDEIIKCEFFNA
jgi:hypothetical protein